MSQKKVIVVYHSGYGHTAFVAKRIEEALNKSGVMASSYEIGKSSVPFDQLQAADALVFGSPTYMGNVSGPFKSFMDETSQVWMKQGWAGKLAAGFTVSGSPSGDKLSTLQSMITFSLQHGMIWTGYNRIPEVYSGVAPEKARNRLGSFSGLMMQAANVAPEEAFVEGDLLSAVDFAEKIAAQLKRIQN